jgi:hypothetical protein
MRLSPIEHTAQPWRIHSLAHDFRLEDVWLVTDSIDCDAFPHLVAGIAAYDPLKSTSSIVRLLFAARGWIGQWFGLDEPGPGDRDADGSLLDQLPDELRNCPGPRFGAVPFRSLYLTDDEFAAEASNRTMHGVLHLGRVRGDRGQCRVQLAVLVRPKGMLGCGYMAAIKPFRHLIYPAMLRELAALGRTSATPA